jgi:uncharacterized protein
VASDLIILSHVQAGPLLAARQRAETAANASLDLNRTQSEVLLAADGVILPDGQTLDWAAVEAIAGDDAVCYHIEAGDAYKIQFFSEAMNRLYALYPTESAPTMLISGLPMHRIKGTDPYSDTREKIRAARPAGRVLDTAMGLGYTAIQAAESADYVLTIELDPAVEQICRLNPWSQALFDNPKIERRIGDAFDVVETLEAAAFNRVIHDPPMFSLAGHLYSQGVLRGAVPGSDRPGPALSLHWRSEKQERRRGRPRRAPAAGSSRLPAHRGPAARFWRRRLQIRRKREREIMLATLVLTNGRFYTMDPARPEVEAIAVRDDTIVATGRGDEMSALLAPGGEWIDLGGRAVTPGLVDAHVHFQSFALNLQRVELHEVPSKEEALRRLEDAAGRLAPGSWLLGRGWTQELWAGRAFPTAADLDAVAGHVPVYLAHKSGHAAWVNSRALQLAGIGSDTGDPPGGQIQRDARGEATGILLESAMDLVAGHIPPPAPVEVAAAMRAAQPVCWQAGLTGLHDFDGRTSFAALQMLQEAGRAGIARGQEHPRLPAGARHRRWPAQRLWQRLAAHWRREDLRRWGAGAKDRLHDCALRGRAREPRHRRHRERGDDGPGSGSERPRAQPDDTRYRRPR